MLAYIAFCRQVNHSICCTDFKQTYSYQTVLNVDLVQRDLLNSDEMCKKYPCANCRSPVRALKETQNFSAVPQISHAEFDRNRDRILHNSGKHQLCIYVNYSLFTLLCTLLFVYLHIRLSIVYFVIYFSYIYVIIFNYVTFCQLFMYLYSFIY